MSDITVGQEVVKFKACGRLLGLRTVDKLTKSMVYLNDGSRFPKKNLSDELPVWGYGDDSGTFILTKVTDKHRELSTLRIKKLGDQEHRSSVCADLTAKIETLRTHYFMNHTTEDLERILNLVNEVLAKQ